MTTPPVQTESVRSAPDLHPTARKRPWTRWVVAAVVLGILALGVGRALNKRKQTQEEAQAAAARLQAPVVFTLSAEDTVMATQQTLRLQVPFSGSLKASQSAVLKAKVAGELSGLQVREGDGVKAGQVLARIDTTEFNARVQQAEQQAQAAAAQVAIAQRNYANNQSLVRQGFISTTALETARATLEGAQSTQQAAVAAVDIARKSLDDTAVRSPIAGQVAARLVQNGERVGVDARILEIVDVRELEVEAALPPSEAAGVRVGQTAQLAIEGMTEPVSAQVARISPVAQAGNRSVLVYLKVTPRPGLRHGLFANGTIQVGTTQGVAIALSAVRNDRPQPYVQLLRPLTGQPDEAQAEVVHQPVRELARGLPAAPTADSNPLILVEGVANNSMIAGARAGFLQEKTRVRVLTGTGTTSGQSAAGR